jgi:transcriptional regulator with XRE-family HTH domain
MAYGDIIKKIRSDKNMSLRDFGKLVDIDFSHLRRLEKEYSNKGKEKLSPSLDILKQICDRSGYPFRQFLEEAGYIEPAQRDSPTVISEELSVKMDKMLKDNFTDEQLSKITDEQLLSVVGFFSNILQSLNKSEE